MSGKLSGCPGCDTGVYRCDPHGWMAGRPCPWCLLDHIRERLRLAEEVVEVARSFVRAVGDLSIADTRKKQQRCEEALADYNKARGATEGGG